MVKPPCSCGHTINFEKCKVFLHQKVRTSASTEPLPLFRTGQTPLVRSADVLYGRLLIFIALADFDFTIRPIVDAFFPKNKDRFD